MAEKHQKTTVTTAADVMAAIYTMVVTSGQTAVRWADNTDTHALYSGTVFASAATVLAGPPATFFANTSSYMVIESAAAMPSTYRWQVKISRGAANANLYINFAARGGWNYLTPGFPTTVPFTGNLDAFGSTIGSASRLLVSTSDLDTYGSGTTYSYLRIMLWESTTVTKSFYVGGYIPFDQTNNTNPACCLVRVPIWNTSGTTLSWGYNLSGGSCLNRIPPEYTGATHDMTVTGYAHIKAMDTAIVNRDPNGNWVNFPVYIRCIDDVSFFGYFGKYTMFAGDTSRSLATADSLGQYLAVNDLIMRWNPTA